MSDKKAAVQPRPEPVVAEFEGRRIVIHPRLCKGCEICVRLCPKAVLVLRDFKASVANLPECSECMVCELRCPDFAIEVHPSGRRKEREKEKP